MPYYFAQSTILRIESLIIAQWLVSLDSVTVKMPLMMLGLELDTLLQETATQLNFV